MPLYEYQCVCGHTVEAIQHYDSPPIKCPECGKDMERRLGTPSLQFKGSGFYSTDYGKKREKEDE